MKNTIREQVTKVLDKIPLVENLSRKKMMSSMLVGMLDSKKVQFKEIAFHVESAAKVESVERRIQAFFAQVDFDYSKVCLLLTLFLGHKKVRLVIDRTEWNFGLYECNILMIVAEYEGVGLPLYWELLDNRSGNSNWADRINLLERFIFVVGKSNIEMVVADREFIGHLWIKYLIDTDIPYCIRVPKSHKITLHNQEVVSISELLATKEVRYFEHCLVDGVRTNCFLKKLANGEYLFLIGSFPAQSLGVVYRKRWSIEVLFQSFKKRGFDLESTHLKSSDKLRKLLVFVSLAASICIRMGEYYNRTVQKIPLKKHGYKANSFFRKGLDVIRAGLKKRSEAWADLFREMVLRFCRWIDIQKAYNQEFTKIIG